MQAARENGAMLLIISRVRLTGPAAAFGRDQRC
jgi:hypothetical protein